MTDERPTSWIAETQALADIPEDDREAMALAAAERTAASASCPSMGLAEWYIDLMAHLDETEERIKEHVRTLMAEIGRRRRGAIMRFGAEVKHEIDAMLKAQGGRKKSVTLATGRAGYRATKGRVVVQDRKALADWCVDHCLDAIETVVARTTPIREHIERTGEKPPGVDLVPPGDVFYPQVTLAALPAAEEGDDQ